MYILNKKRILIIFVCFIISTIALELKKAERINIKETVALPVNKKVIIIDAGHGGEDGGATTDERNFRS